MHNSGTGSVTLPAAAQQKVHCVCIDAPPTFSHTHTHKQSTPFPGLLRILYCTSSAAMRCCLCSSAVLSAAVQTTGGDREKLAADVRAADLYAVIAPQMGKQVVAFQAMMEMMAQQFPGAFSGYTLKVCMGATRCMQQP